jgi:hypothetical protein
MLFRYFARPVPHPVPSLKGARIRHLPLVPIWLTYAGADIAFNGLVDSAASNVVIPLGVAHRLGIDLTHAPVGQSRQAGGAWLQYRYEPGQLRLSDGRETCLWHAVVGFLDAPMPWALLGQAGCLEYLDAFLYGARREVEITPNGAFAGSLTGH